MKTEDTGGAIGAVLMHEAADIACEAGHAAMVAAVEKELPDREDRQVGAIITAATMLYAHMLTTCVAAGGQKEAKLAIGMVKTLLADPLRDIAKLADGGTDGEK